MINRAINHSTTLLITIILSSNTHVHTLAQCQSVGRTGIIDANITIHVTTGIQNSNNDIISSESNTRSTCANMPNDNKLSYIQYSTTTV